MISISRMTEEVYRALLPMQKACSIMIQTAQKGAVPEIELLEVYHQTMEQLVREGYCFEVEEWEELSSTECDSVESLLEYLVKSYERITDHIVGFEHDMRHRKTCCCCNHRVHYLPLSPYFKQMSDRYGYIYNHLPSETINHEEYTCPACGCVDRDRLILMFLQMIAPENDEKLRLLNIAPSLTMERWILLKAPHFEYESTDLFMDGVTFKSDLQDMNMVEDETYDVFICSHILEHVRDDRKAMRELHRILKNNGVGIVLVPMKLGMDQTHEEWGLSPEENWRRFGQDDHCRVYEKSDFVHRLEEQGFYVYQLGKEFFGENAFYENGLTDTSTLYIVSKEKIQF